MLQFAERDMGGSEPLQIIDKIEYSYKDPAGKSELRCLENQIFSFYWVYAIFTLISLICLQVWSIWH